MPLQGSITVPGDKSISHRALMLSALSKGQSRISGLAKNQDVLATRRCLEALGFGITEENDTLLVSGNPDFKAPAQTLDAMNSGTTIRLLSGILAAQPFETKITGDESLQKRPMGRIIEPLSKMGAHIESTDGHAPLTIHACAKKLHGINYTLPHASAQIKSAILLAGLYAEGDTRITEPLASRDHTERMLRYLGVDLRCEEKTLLLPGGQFSKLNATQWKIPGDISSAAFWLVAGLLVPGSEVRLQNIGLNPGRTGILNALTQANAKIVIENQHNAVGEAVGDLLVTSTQLCGNITLTAADIPGLIDELPILAVAGVFLDGVLSIRGAQELRVKESDRIAAIATEFGKLGIEVTTTDDGFDITGQPDRQLKAPTDTLNAHHDHRIAMSLRILNAIAAPDHAWAIMGDDHIAVSYPGFEQTLKQLRTASR